ncbi:hypothetical protein OIU81_03265 [Streptomyces sp. NBC_01454]|uniref:hypothetical protein n=1 Tax=Streptomyces sp. NBC_01454 TaxID=2975867 RepID=UPI002E320B0A|nr:hypothetical protein [Streptomyces sp. NBC_01454]
MTDSSFATDTHFSGALVLGNDEARADYRRGIDGRTFGMVHVGRRMTVHVADATPETLDSLAEAFAELAAWKRNGGIRAVAS